MAELALVSSVIAVIEISRDVIIRAYDYGQAVESAKEDMQRVQAEVQDLEDILGKLRDLERRAEASRRSLTLWPTLVSLQDPTSSLHKCQKELEKLQKGLAPVGFWEKSKARALWPHKQNGLYQILDTIRQQKVHLAEALNIDQTGQVLETAQVVEDTAKLQIAHKDVSQSTEAKVKLLKASRIHRRRKFSTDNILITLTADDLIIRWLLSTDASINHVAAIDKRMKSTGQWFLESTEYHSWKHDSSSFLWLHGPSGCGKTVLCSTIVEDTRASCKASPVAFYYFDITDREKQKVSSLLRSILGQLCTQMAAVPETVSALHKTYKFGSHIPQQPLIDTLDSILPQIDKPHVFIDALDECEDTDQLLKAIKKLHGNLQILVTSQKQSKLSDTLQGIATEISIQSEVIDRDIGLHVQESLNDGKLRQWKNHPIKDKIINTLQDGAGGSFRWVSCQIDSLGGCSSEDDVRSALEDLPRDLNHTYDRILKRIYDQDQRSKGKTAAKIKAALQWLAFARRPLLLQEVLEAAVINPEHPFEISARILLEPHFISDSCSSLVVITASTRRGCEKLEELKFAHPSVQRYLTSERIQSSGEHASLFSFSFSENDAHSFIGRSCLRYLLQFDKPETLNWKTLLTFPLAKYSAKFWVDHYTAIGDNPDRTRLDDLGIELLESERNSFKNWIRICDFFQHWRIHGELERTIFDPPLCYIARLGLLGLARRLLEKGANVNAQGGVYGNALQAAVFRGNVKLVQLLLNEGADVNAQGGEYGNALQAAASGGRVEIVQLLLNNGADVNAQGGTYGNALQAAAPGGCVEIVQLLLNEGADVNAQSEKYGNALRAAAWDGDVEIVQLLLTEGADVNAQGGGYGNALQAAAWRGGAETVQLLLNEGADVNAQGGEYGNALQAAAWKGSAEAVQLLLNEGADVNAQGGCCGSALRAAVSIRNVKIVNLLLDNGADVSSEGLCKEATKSRNEVLTLLLSRGLDLTRTDHQGMSILHRATAEGDIKRGKTLLEFKLEACALDKQGRNWLHLASDSGDIQTIEMFLDLGLDPGALDKQGRNCLHHAASSGKAPAVVRLLTEGLSSNCADRDGWTPLHWAAKGTTTRQEQGDLIIRYLLDAGANPKLKTTEGWTPHSVASFHHQTKLLPLLAASECEHVDEGHSNMGPSLRHRNAYCDGCSMDIYGLRYRCLDCAPPRFDFCFKCNYSVAETHPDHKFEVFEAP